MALELIDDLLLSLEFREHNIYNELGHCINAFDKDQIKYAEIFKDEPNDNIECDQFNHNHAQCASLKRLLFALKLDSILTEDSFNVWMDKTYSQCLDDYNHLVSKHDINVSQIYDAMMKHQLFTFCDIKHCQFTIRHHHTNNLNSNASNHEALSQFYRGTMDGLHFWLFHQYDAGLRFAIGSHHDKLHDKQTANIQQVKYYDPQFSHYMKQIAIQRRNVSALERFSSATNTKYTFIGSSIKDKTVSSLSTFRFFYWPSYEHNESRVSNHSGHRICDLFVNKKYETFKEEMAHYHAFSLAEYQSNVMVKIQHYLRSKVVKSLKAYGGFTYRYYGVKEVSYDYNIAKDSPLGFEHLLSVILATDYLKLNADFRATLRQKDALETLQNVKQRNSSFWWWSKTLRETVEIYGGCKWGDGYHTNSDAAINQLNGPFYGIMPAQHYLATFNIRLSGAISISKQLGFAMTLAADEGAIVQLNNPDMEQCRFLRAFDCKYLSRYKEESEVILFGAYPICVESVRLTKTMQKFESIVYLFAYLDIIVSGGTRFDIRSVQTTEAESKMIIELLSKTDTNTSLDTYIESCFQCFCSQKKDISLNLWAIYEIDERIRDMILNPLEVREQKDERKRFDDDTKNLIRNEIFEIFPNLRRIQIASSLLSGRASCSMSLVGLLSLFGASHVLEQVTVTAMSDTSGNNWIQSQINAAINGLKDDEYLSPTGHPRDTVDTFVSYKQENDDDDKVSQCIRLTTSRIKSTVNITRIKYADSIYTIAVKKVKSDEYELDIQKHVESVHDLRAMKHDQEAKDKIEEKEDAVWHQGSPETKIVADHYYTVQCKQSGLYWDILDASTQNGANLLQYYYHGNNNQIFSFIHRGNGQYSIHPMCSEKCIQIKDASTENGALLIQSDIMHECEYQLFVCEMNSKAQNVDVLPNGCYRFRSVYNHKCIDVAGASATKGVYLQQWDEHKGTNQQFVIKRVDLERRVIGRAVNYVYEMTKHKNANCWLYSWFWSSEIKKEFDKQLKKKSVEEVIFWLVNAYKNSNGFDPWMNVLKDACDEDVKGVIDDLIKCKNEILLILSPYNDAL